MKLDRQRQAVQPAADLVEIDQDPRSGAEWYLSTLVDMNEGINTVLFGGGS
jgi:hypothetical protein